MSDAQMPERIFVIGLSEDHPAHGIEGAWHSDPGAFGGAEFVRADLRASGQQVQPCEIAAHCQQIVEYADMMGTGLASYIGAIKRRAKICAALTPAPEAAQAEAVPTCTGIKDMDGNVLFLGDRVRYLKEGPHTKPEYWNPEYKIIWKAPSFTLKHVGGGKDGGSHDFILRHGGKNGVLELVKRNHPAAPAPEAAQAEAVPVDDRSLQFRISEIGNQIHTAAFEHQDDEDLSEWLADVRSRLLAIAQELAPPAAPAPGIAEAKRLLSAEALLAKPSEYDSDEKELLTYDSACGQLEEARDAIRAALRALKGGDANV